MMVTLSMEAVAQAAFAQGALRHILHHDRPAMLTEAHRKALNGLIERGFLNVALSLMPNALSAERADEGMLRMEVRLGDEGADYTALLRPAMEDAVLAYVTARAYDGVDAELSEAADARFEELCGKCRSICGMSSRKPRLRPAWGR